MQVIPHDELREREHAENAGIHYLPAVFGSHCSPERIKDGLNIDSARITGKLSAQLFDVDIEVLPEFLQYGYVDADIFIGLLHGIFAEADLTLELDRDKNERRIVRFCFAVVVPLKESACKEQSAGTVFFDCQLRAPVELLHPVIVFLLRERSIYPGFVGVDACRKHFCYGGSVAYLLEFEFKIGDLGGLVLVLTGIGSRQDRIVLFL